MRKVLLKTPIALIQRFIALSKPTIDLEASLQLYSVSKPDREPVKILVIGSQAAVNTIIHSLHHHRFAEPFEWTPFLPTDRPIHIQTGESLRSLVKYLPRQ